MLADSEATVLFQDTQARGNRGSGSGPLPLQVSHPSLLIATTTGMQQVHTRALPGVLALLFGDTEIVYSSVGVTSNFGSSCLHFLRAKILGVSQHVWVIQCWDLFHPH